MNSESKFAEWFNHARGTPESAETLDTPEPVVLQTYLLLVEP